MPLRIPLVVELQDVGAHHAFEAFPAANRTAQQRDLEEAFVGDPGQGPSNAPSPPSSFFGVVGSTHDKRTLHWAGRPCANLVMRMVPSPIQSCRGSCSQLPFHRQINLPLVVCQGHVCMSGMNATLQ